ncbi:MAG: ABC transporter permease [Alphaproteobacteria bacterium]|nr:ABC transporter permease [Alphaproteobacteria bacterium]
MTAASLYRYVLLRLVQLVPVVFLIIILNFFLIRLAPGDPIAYIIGDAPIADELVADLRSKLGLDGSITQQLLIYLSNVAQGDFGFSYVSRAPVTEVILSRLPATLLLMITQYVLAIAVGIVLGVLSARHQGSALDVTVTAVSVVGYALPVFWLGQMLMLMFSMKLGLFPAQGMMSLRYSMTPVEKVFDIAHHLVLPALTLAIFNLALIARLARANMLQVLRLEYIIFARSKGISERAVVYRHALRNAVLPVVTVIGLNIKTLITGAVLTETVFAWPGLGRLTFDAINARDYPVLMAMFVFVGILVVIANLITDIIYAWLDPRIRLQ